MRCVRQTLQDKVWNEVVMEEVTVEKTVKN
jgi:hypothetical protein